jgi:hypothetical protein
MKASSQTRSIASRPPVPSSAICPHAALGAAETIGEVG